MRKCTKCNRELEEKDFYINPDGAITTSWCSACHRDASKRRRNNNLYQARHREGLKAQKFKHHNLQYGPTERRLCSKCKIDKQSADFFLALTHKDGLSSRCKACSIHEISVTKKKCRFCKNIKAASLFNRNYSHKDGLSDNCKFCAQRLSGYYSIARGDKKRGQSSCTLEEWIKISTSICSYCSYPATGGDRIDNSKGHTPDNLLPACAECNLARKDYWTVAEMKEVLGPAIKRLKDNRHSNFKTMSVDISNSVQALV